MSSISVSSFPSRGWSTPTAIWSREPALVLVSGGCLVLAALLAPAVGLDSRTVGGVNVWLKPLKFLISFGIFSATLAWLLSYLPRAGREGLTLGRALALIVIGENAVLLVQAARGIPSHFNTSTLVDTALFYGMGAGVIVMTALLLRIRAAFGRPVANLAEPLRQGFRAGLTLFLLGTVPGWLMIAWGTHTVGAPDGGPGLPWLNWSLTAGDLRVAHFLGLHALQVLPLCGALLKPRANTTQVVLDRRVAAIAVAYGVLIVGALAQALAGHPLTNCGLSGG